MMIRLWYSQKIWVTGAILKERHSKMGFFHIIKPVEKFDDGEINGTYVQDVQHPKMHGSRPKWEGNVVRGEQHRRQERPKGNRPGGKGKPGNKK
jgi:hypothetical protein